MGPISHMKFQQAIAGDTLHDKILARHVFTIDLNMGFAHLSKGNNSSGETVQTKYGETPVGSFLRYQVSFTESNLSAEAHLNFSTPK